MPSDIRLAFSPLDDRASASAPAMPHDRISVRDHLVLAEIGAFQQERGRQQRLRFNVVVEVQPLPDPLEDDVDRILSYDVITDAIAAELATERLNLLETLAERVAERVLAAPQAMRAFVRIEKLDRGPGALGVEIMRARAQSPTRKLGNDGLDQALHPVVAYLDNEAIHAPDLAARLDGLADQGRPVVLTVGLPDGPRPVGAIDPVQRRIDLLAVEQNAWVLAGQDPRCVVVSSRTEIDWAMRQGQMVVWAPSKIILDSPDSPKGPVRDGVALALWLAELLAAERLVVHGAADAPAGSRIPVTRA